ncbi:hypothetical protein LSUE1_G005011 [Lachnellula suecica]|uniref:Uncharacterized protein n=1 Tax=Lachnellula suecica TaxID=602035 RepID=A0A8T9CD67_9HELO|nr:hypothetical protein LSUE1_G005011 [Lachnellula suecica]
MAGVQNGPIPTTLTLLSNLRNFAPGTKVRFLGCVKNYVTKTGILTLEHNHPQGQPLKALVNIDLILSTIKSHETRVGEWVNVMGYIHADSQSNSKHPGANDSVVQVQALVLWSSGPFDLQAYERSLDEQNSNRDSG